MKEQPKSFLPIGMGAELSDTEYVKLADYVYQHCGIALGSNKQHLVKARLMKRLRFYGFASFEQYYDFVTSAEGEGEIIELINRISTNTTHFFREEKHFEYLSNVVLPEIMAKKKKSADKKVRLWCSASSTGEEPYCLMMTVLEFMEKNNCDWDFKLLATDISTKVLGIASQGEYSHDKTDKIPKQLLLKYFEKVQRPQLVHYRIKPEYRKYVVFRRLNLISPSFPFKGKFDVIFCRNVMIYFDKETQVELVNKFYKFLESGAHLFIGHSENLMGAELKFKRVASAVFKRD